MSDPVEPLIVDLLERLAPRPRPYAEVIEVWGTSCPRLPVWEEANQRGFVEHRHIPGQPASASVSAAGLAHLRATAAHAAARQHRRQHGGPVTAILGMRLFRTKPTEFRSSHRPARAAA